MIPFARENLLVVSKARTRAPRVAYPGGLLSLLSAALLVLLTALPGIGGATPRQERASAALAEFALGAISPHPAEPGQRGRWSTSSSRQLTGREREPEPELDSGAEGGPACPSASARVPFADALALGRRLDLRPVLEAVAQLPRPPPVSS